MKRLAALLSMAALVAACTTVDQTEHCVGVQYGKVTEKRMDVGLNLTIIEHARCFSLQAQNYPSTKGGGESFSAATRDPVELTGKVSAVYQFQNIDRLYIEKQSEENATTQMHNALRDAITTATAMFTIDQMFGPHRAAFNDSVKAIAQRKAGDDIKFVTIYLTDLQPPKAIAEARIVAAQKETELQTAKNQRIIDSVEARSVVIKAEAEAKRQELEARAIATSPEVLKLRAAQAMAEGFKDICKGTTTCIIGGNVLDGWLNAGTRRP